MAKKYVAFDDVIDALERTTWYHQNGSEMVEGANSAEHQPWYKSQDIYDAVQNLPAADVVEVKHGHWIEEIILGNRRHPTRRICSNCGANNNNRKSNYCPVCGAKMEGGGE